MNKEEIKRQLKLSKQQNKNERYDYLCSQFNCVNYAIKLEKYTIKLQQETKRLNGAIQTYDILLKANAEENKQLKEQLQNISNEFLKYDWKNATQEQVYNQLKSLYESIFKEV